MCERLSVELVATVNDGICELFVVLESFGRFLLLCFIRLRGHNDTLNFFLFIYNSIHKNHHMLH